MLTKKPRKTTDPSPGPIKIIRKLIEKITFIIKKTMIQKKIEPEEESQTLRMFHLFIRGGMRRLMYSCLLRWTPTLSARVPAPWPAEGQKLCTNVTNTKIYDA